MRTIFAIYLSISIGANAQSVNTLVGTRSMGMGYTSATLTGVFSIQNNIGAIADHRYISVGAAYEINPSLPGGDRMSATSIVPLGKGSAGIGFFRFGDAVYSEQVISVGYGNRLGLASLGAKINYIEYRSEGFPTKSLVSLTLGGIARITPKFSIGAYATNINRPVMVKSNDERLPTILALGLQFTPHKNLVLVVDIEKDLQYKPTIKGGVEYKALKKIFIRTGFSVNPDAVTAGIAYQLWRLQIGYAIYYDLTSISRHQTDISYNIRKAKNK